MPKPLKNQTEFIFDLIPKLIEAGLTGDRQRLEVLSVTAARRLKPEQPTTANQIAQLLATFNCDANVRWASANPIPTDQDEGMSLLKHDRLPPIQPIFNIEIQNKIQSFVKERSNSTQLLSEGFLPPRTLLLKGAPGTGKTSLARYIASELGLPLFVLDLTTTISSFLGKTGMNLRRSLDFARSNPCVLLLDEFDAVAKKRNDLADVGELSRIVNVLLKELEDWPINSVLIAATNHPDMLDRAINRRFDVVFDIPLPGYEEKEIIAKKVCGRFADSLPFGFFAAFAHCLPDVNASELENLIRSSIRRHIMEESSLPVILIEQIIQSKESDSKKHIGHFIRALKEYSTLTVREIGSLVNLSPATVQYHLKKEISDA